MTRKPRHALVLDHAPSDYGPSFNRAPGGQPKAWGGAAEVVIEDRPDPDKPDRGRTPPTVRGARRYDGLVELYDRKAPEYVAAERFRNDCALAGGARPEANQATVRLAFDPGKYGPSDVQIDAQTRATAAWQAMGLIAAGVISWVVVGNGSLRTYEAAKGGRKGRASVVLKAALLRLVAHYDGADRTGKRNA